MKRAGAWRRAAGLSGRAAARHAPSAGAAAVRCAALPRPGVRRLGAELGLLLLLPAGPGGLRKVTVQGRAPWLPVPRRTVPAIPAPSSACVRLYGPVCHCLHNGVVRAFLLLVGALIVPLSLLFLTVPFLCWDLSRCCPSLVSTVLCQPSSLQAVLKFLCFNGSFRFCTVVVLSLLLGSAASPADEPSHSFAPLCRRIIMVLFNPDCSMVLSFHAPLPYCVTAGHKLVPHTD